MPANDYRSVFFGQKIKFTFNLKIVASVIMCVSNAAVLTAYHFMVTTEEEVHQAHVDEFGDSTDLNCDVFESLSTLTTQRVTAGLGVSIAISFLLDMIWIFTLRPEI